MGRRLVSRLAGRVDIVEVEDSQCNGLRWSNIGLRTLSPNRGRQGHRRDGRNNMESVLHQPPLSHDAGRRVSRRGRQRLPPRLHRFGRHRIPSAGPVNEMDMAALGRRGNKARHLRRPLPEDAPMDKRVRGGKPSLERIGELKRAVERHAQAVVELAKIGVGDKLARISRRVEATHS